MTTSELSPQRLLAKLREQHGAGYAPPMSVFNRLWVLTRGAPVAVNSCVVANDDPNIATWQVNAVTESALVLVTATGKDIMRFNYEEYREDVDRGLGASKPSVCAIAHRLSDVIAIETREDDGVWSGTLGMGARQFFAVTLRDGKKYDLPPRRVVETSTAYWVEHQRLIDVLLA